MNAGAAPRQRRSMPRAARRRGSSDRHLVSPEHADFAGNPGTTARRGDEEARIAARGEIPESGHVEEPRQRRYRTARAEPRIGGVGSDGCGHCERSRRDNNESAALRSRIIRDGALAAKRERRSRVLIRHRAIWPFADHLQTVRVRPAARDLHAGTFETARRAFATRTVTWSTGVPERPRQASGDRRERNSSP